MTKMVCEGFEYTVHFPGGRSYTHGKYVSSVDSLAIFKAIAKQNPALVHEMANNLFSLTPETTTLQTFSSAVFCSRFWDTFLLLSDIYDYCFESTFYPYLFILLFKYAPKNLAKTNPKLYF